MANDMKIPFSVQVPVEEFGMDDEDICSILQNLVKNALEAASKVSHYSKHVTLQVLDTDDGYEIRCINDCMGEVNFDKTSKQNKQMHGLGVGIVDKIVAEHYGTIQRKYEKTEDEEIGHVTVSIQFLSTIELAILDIDLEGSVLNGIQLARRILELNPCAVFIFITSHREFAHDATKIHLSGFLDKPLNPFDFKDALSRAITQVNGYRMKNYNNNMATFQNEKILLKEKSIISIEKVAKTHEVEILTTEKKIWAFDSIKNTEKRLSSNFVKLNCSVIVNLSYVFNIEGDIVMMRGGARYSVSVRNRIKVRKAYEEYISRKFV